MVLVLCVIEREQVEFQMHLSSGHSPNETSYQHKNSRSPFSVCPYAERTLKLHWLKETKRGGGKDEVKYRWAGKRKTGEKVFVKANKGELAVFQKGAWRLRRMKCFRIHLHQA